MTSTVAPNSCRPSDLVGTQGKQAPAGCPQLMRCPGNVEDIVAQHHQHNRPPHLPNNVQLFTIQSQQGSQRVEQTCSAASDTDQRSHSISHTHSVAYNTDKIEAPISSHLREAVTQPPPTDSNSLPAARLASFSVHTYSGDPSQLSFYSPPVHDIIKHAKQISHCDLASLNSFLLCPQFNTKASEYIDEVIIEHRN